MKWMSLLWTGLGCFLLGLSFIGGSFLYAGLVSLPCFFMAWLTRGVTYSEEVQANSAVENVTSESPVIRSKETVATTKTQSVLSIKERRVNDLKELEALIDKVILDGFMVLKDAIKPVHTLAVFFPSRLEGYYLRVWMTQSDSIIPGASVQVGQGLVGILFKEGQTRILEEDITTPSTNLQYYSQDEKVRSIAGVPILVHGARRGAIVADSLVSKSFNLQTIDVLNHFANFVGHFIYYAYLSLENSYQRDQLAALSSYQRKFLENMSEEEIVVYIQQYVEQTLEADRILLIARSREDVSKATVVAVKGLDASYFENFEFYLAEKGLAALVLEKEQIINKSIKPGEVFFRLSSRERLNDKFKSLLAVPLKTDRGVTHVLMVESTRRTWFSEHQKELLLTISRSASFALARARLYQEKETMARCDGLTGLLNHRTFQEQYKKEMLRANREGYALTILMVDIDYFKKVNDTYGHPVGDVVLKEVSRILSQMIRAGSDTVARYGGEEFVCLLIGASLQESRDSAERIRQTIKNKEFDVGGGMKLKVTTSIGGARYPDDGSTGKDVLDKADKALYHAKKTGRDKVIFYTDS